jgi:hypothetical protein
MDAIHTLRNTYSADVVVLLENISFTGGIGWLLNTTAGLPTYAFFADGITHTRVPYFSNPSINYLGLPTGDAVDGDNARTLREIKSVVAAYRNAPCVTPTLQASLFGSSGATMGSVNISWTRGTGSQVLVLVRQGSAVNSSPVNGTAYPANARFASGTQVGSVNYAVYSGTGNAVTVTGLQPETTYYFTVFEFNSPSNCYLTPGLTGNAATLVPVPAPPVALAATSITTGSFRANWNSASGATAYYLDVATSNTFDSGIVLNDVNVGNVTYYPVSGLSNSTTYYYRVRAANSSGSSGNSSIISLTTLTPPPPSDPVALSASYISQTSFQANWNVSSGATGYYLDVSTTNKFTGFVTGYNNKNVGNVTTFQVTGLTAGKNYYYRVRAYYSGGTSANSNTIPVVTPTSDQPADEFVSKLLANQSGQFTGFPNPFSESIHFSYSVPVSGRTTLEICDITGRKVVTLVDLVQDPGYYEVNWQPENTKIQSLHMGVYIAVFRSGDTSRSIKLVYQGQ